ncbi:MAG: BACON domain-containing protein, partial [Bacteroidales bacterium]|nr:BACON domain-containing protein [Bacteroidales bacterium]
MKATLKYLLCAAVLMASVASTVLSCTDTRSQLDRIHRQIEDPSLAALAAAVGHNDPLTGFTPVAENGAITAYKVTFKSAGDVTVYNGSHIASVTEDAARVVFTLSDGTQIIIPKLQALTIALQGDQATIKAGETVTVGYTIEGAEDATVTVLCGDGWSAAVKASGKQTGTIIVTAPTPVEQDKVIVFAGDGTGRLVAVEMRLTIDTSGDPDPPTPPDPPDPPVDPILVPVKTAYSVFKAGGQVEAGLIANVDYSVTTDAGWLHYLGTKAVRTDTLLFNVDANVGPARSATATISAGNYSTQITFHQE